MEMNEYQESAMLTSVLKTEEDQVQYGVLNVTSEAGEIAGKFAKAIRDDTDIDTMDLVKEMGDVLWCLACLAQGIGVTLEEVAEVNLQKLESRQQRGTISGSGDDR